MLKRVLEIIQPRPLLLGRKKLGSREGIDLRSHSRSGDVLSLVLKMLDSTGRRLHLNPRLYYSLASLDHSPRLSPLIWKWM